MFTVRTFRVEEVEDKRALLQKLDSGSMQEKKQAISVLKPFIADNSANRNLIMTFGGVPILMKALNDRDPDIQLDALLLLTRIAHDNLENTNAVIAAGGIPAFANLLRSHQPGQIYSAAAIMTLLMKNASAANQNQLRELGVIPLLVSFISITGLINPDNSKLTMASACILAKLAFNNPVNQNAIREAGAIPILANLLRPANLEVNRELQEYLVTALNNLATDNVPNQNAIRETGCIPTIETLSQHSDPDIRTQVAEILPKLRGTAAAFGASASREQRTRTMDPGPV